MQSPCDSSETLGEMGLQWLEHREGEQGKTEGKRKGKEGEGARAEKTCFASFKSSLHLLSRQWLQGHREVVGVASQKETVGPRPI